MWSFHRTSNMDSFVSDCRRLPSHLEIDLLAVPSLQLTTHRLVDFSPSTTVRVHISNECLLVEYHCNSASLIRAVYSRKSMKVIDISWEPTVIHGKTEDRYSPYRVTRQLSGPLVNLLPAEYIEYGEKLYKITTISSFRTNIDLKIVDFAGSVLESFKTEFTFERDPLAAFESSGYRPGKTHLYDYYVTDKFVLVYQKSGNLAAVWDYRANTVTIVQLKKVQLTPFIAQRSCNGTAYFLDSSKRIVVMDDSTLRVLDYRRYTAIVGLLYARMKWKLTIPKPLLQVICGYVLTL